MEYLNDMALFVEVVKAKGFRHAAEALGIPNSTVSRRIAQLEKSIGLRLLHRTTRRTELTEAGQLYYDRCRRIVDEARIAHEQLGELLAQPTGVLRVSLPVDFAVTYLAPLITEFAELYPGLTFDFDLTPRRVNLVSEPFDVAIRIGESPDSQLIARPLATLTSNVYAAPGYLAAHGTPLTPHDLEAHACLNMLRGGFWELRKDGHTERVGVSSRYTLNSVGMIRKLAVLNQGILLAPEEIVADEITSGELVRILDGWQGQPMTIYATTETRLLPAKTQRFIEFLRERLSSSE
ncbi:LysR family transcriptional regulator [uncultured Pseudomonas sp.]|uniref:LysR family transcriptional regulator n=1 Tax=uncultured Pseudomonas sp. TaxID=114707 RepID=UPI00259087CD|nr:LysR family transcriptional regulator [uncultured Pseudomonas sp.]